MDLNRIAGRVAGNNLDSPKTAGKFQDFMRFLKGKPSEQDLQKSQREFAKGARSMILESLKGVQSAYGDLYRIWAKDLYAYTSYSNADKSKMTEALIRVKQPSKSGSMESVYVMKPEFNATLMEKADAKLTDIVESIEKYKNGIESIMKSPFMDQLVEMAKSDEVAAKMLREIKKHLAPALKSVNDEIGKVSVLNPNPLTKLENPDDLYNKFHDEILYPVFGVMKKLQDDASEAYGNLYEFEQSFFKSIPEYPYRKDVHAEG